MGQEGLPAISYPPGTILAGHVGSVAYGLSTPESDVDTLGVFVAPTREILGLHPERASQQSIVTSAPPTRFHIPRDRKVLQPRIESEPYDPGTVIPVPLHDQHPRRRRTHRVERSVPLL